MLKRTVTLVSLMITCLIGLSGCVAVVAAGGAAGGVAYVRGELQMQLDQPAHEVNSAVEDAAKEMELFQVERKRDLIGGQFVYRNAQDQKITITTEAQGQQITQLSIRVGIFGDQQQSQVILDRIRSHLPKGAK